MSLHLTFRTVKGENYQLTCEPTTAIGACKKQLLDKDIHRPVTLSCVYRGCIIDDLITLKDLKISDGDVIIIVEKAINPPAPAQTSIPTPTQTSIPTPQSISAIPHVEPAIPIRVVQPDADPNMVITPLDFDHIVQLVSLGFTEEESIQTYYACDCNLELATDILVNDH